MIAYEDFAPKILERGGLFKRAIYETFDEAVAAANAWVEAEGVRVVTIETVVLPNIWKEEGTTDVKLHTERGQANWHQFVRVWYERA